MKVIYDFRNVDAKCPSCGEVLAEQTMFPDNFAKREINNLKVHCTNQGCQEQVELLHLKASLPNTLHIYTCTFLVIVIHNLCFQTHLENCRFCEIQCPSHCGKFILKNDMQRHVQYECDNRNIVCQLCHREILFVEKEVNTCICRAVLVYKFGFHKNMNISYYHCRLMKKIHVLNLK